MKVPRREVQGDFPRLKICHRLGGRAGGYFQTGAADKVQHLVGRFDKFVRLVCLHKAREVRVQAAGHRRVNLVIVKLAVTQVESMAQAVNHVVRRGAVVQGHAVGFVAADRAVAVPKDLPQLF